ncbi:no exine formation 1 [Zea mays]|uniref:No exine formation 1 n=1 Tax=Zea mays TaxID=4577 RepID=A0A1D6F5W5_MAIZE|nr:no exine formation 1 [Zea mays]
MDPSSGSTSRHGRLLISPSLSTPTFSTHSPSPSSAASPAPHRNSTSSPKPLVSFPSPSSANRPRSSYVGAGPRAATAAASASGPAFAHNARLAAALVPAAAFLLDLGGLPVFAVLAIGLAAAYLLDALQLRQGSFFTVWAALLAADVAFFFSASLSSAAAASLPLTVLALLLCAETSFLIGVWASLQFRWIQLENPTIVAALERLLFACVPIAAPALFTWALVSAVGMANASYYFATFCMVFYWLFSIPRRSSFNSRKQDAPMLDSDGILGPLESCVHSLYVLFVPVLFHAVSHRATLFTSLASVCELLLLFFIPFLFQLYASTRGALWWITRDARTMDQIRIVNGFVALVVVVLCLEVRVVFHSFGRYIHAPPPLNYLLVTVTMLGGALGLAAHAAGKVGDAASSVAFTGLAVLVSGAGAVVIGFPMVFLPLPMISGYYVARFFTKKSLSSYFTFVALASLMVLWFVVHNYWDLNIWIAGMPLKSFTKYVVAAVIMAMAVPGLALLPTKLRFLLELGLIGHTLLLCYIENRLFNYASMYYYGFEEDIIYPNYMVFITTFLGLALVRRLYVDQRLGPKAAWILTCLYSSKLAMLFMTSRSVIWFSAVLLLAVTPPLLLYRDKSKGASKMKVWQAYFHASVIAFSAWLCRETIFEALQWWNGRPPSDGLLLGSYILLTGVACIPIVALHFPHAQSAKRFLVLIVATGLLFVVMQPPIKLSWVYRSDFITAAHLSDDDISIYGFVASKPSWPSWLLIATVVLTLAAVTSIIPVKYVVELRTSYAVAVGITLGIYISVQYFFQAVVLYPLLVATIVSAAVFVVFTHLPSESSTRVLPWVFSFLAADRGMHGPSSRSAAFPPKARLLQQRRAHAAPTFTIKRLAAEAAWMPAIGNVSTVLCFGICLVLNLTLTGGSNRAIFFLAPILLLLNQDSDIFAGFGDRQRYFPVTVSISGYLLLTALYRIWEETWPGNGGWALDIGGPGWLFAVKNFALLVLTLPNHILFNRFMWDYVRQTDAKLLLTLPLNLPSIIMTDILTIRVLGLLGAMYSLAQYMISRRIRIAGMRYI